MNEKYKKIFVMNEEEIYEKIFHFLYNCKKIHFEKTKHKNGWVSLETYYSETDIYKLIKIILKQKHIKGDEECS